MARTPTMRRLVLALGLLAPGSLAAQARLTLFNAGSLGKPLREALQEFVRRNPGVEPAQENSGSLEAARKLTDLGKVPDIIALADEAVFPALLMPGQVRWYAAFARNEMVLAYTDQSRYAADVTAANWPDILLRPDVRTGRSAPALDPNGYRTLMVAQLEARRRHDPTLAGRLVAAMGERYIRPKESDLVAQLQAGELDYAWSYRSIAETAGLRYVDLPSEVDLSDPAREAAYAEARVQVPRHGSGGADSVTVVGAPILYALAIPTAAPQPALAQRFVEFLFSPDGRAILERNGLTVLDRPILHGDTPRWLRTQGR
ncbi:MAG TPA: extracellular solute-binding protein [Gemmatimonadales bacterium]|nr:extracellular solute-binding protein [Gemmatimonadales bacterium]